MVVTFGTEEWNVGAPSVPNFTPIGATCRPVGRKISKLPSNLYWRFALRAMLPVINCFTAVLVTRLTCDVTSQDQRWCRRQVYCCREYLTPPSEMYHRRPPWRWRRPSESATGGNHNDEPCDIPGLSSCIRHFTHHQPTNQPWVPHSSLDSLLVGCVLGQRTEQGSKVKTYHFQWRQVTPKCRLRCKAEHLYHL